MSGTVTSALPPAPKKDQPTNAARQNLRFGTAQMGEQDKASLKELHKDNSVKLNRKNIDKLQPNERRWTDNVLRVLKLPNKGSQARILAGAVASHQRYQDLIDENYTDSEEAKKEHEYANKLLKKVLAAGEPPWKDPQRAMVATEAKVELDLLSIGPNERKVEPLGGGQKGINDSYWIKRRDADGQLTVSFICKPHREVDQDSRGPRIDGVPQGGQTLREALTSRAAQIFARQTGLDVGVPETHLVNINKDFIPEETGSEKIECSVQEARPSGGQLANVIGNPEKIKNFDKNHVAALAVFDMLTLNGDRHSGNLLLPTGQDTRLIPIDHGVCFLDPHKQDDQTESGLRRLRLAMGGPNSALLRIPQAHEPLDEAILRKLRALKPDDYGKALKADRDAIVREHPGHMNKISDDAIKTAQRAALFVKLAANHKPPLTPAAMQVALASNAETLLDPKKETKDFEKDASKIIEDIAKFQDVLKEVCLMSDEEYEKLTSDAENKIGKVGKVRKLNVLRRGDSPEVNFAIADPIKVAIMARSKNQFSNLDQAQGLELNDENKKLALLAIIDVKERIYSRLRETFFELQRKDPNLIGKSPVDPSVIWRRDLMPRSLDDIQRRLDLVTTAISSLREFLKSQNLTEYSESKKRTAPNQAPA